MIMEILYTLTSIYVAIGVTWRLVCLFRKKGSCKFTACPFRRDYTSISNVYFPPGGCTKCPPTESEKIFYENSVYGLMDNLLKKDK